jgi:hypothetical protein
LKTKITSRLKKHSKIGEENNKTRKFKVKALPWQSEFASNLLRKLDQKGREKVDKDKRGGNI